MGECPYYRSKASADCWPDPDDGYPDDCMHGRADYDTCPIAWAMRESGRADAAEKRVVELEGEVAARDAQIVGLVRHVRAFDEHFSRCSNCYGAKCRAGDTLLSVLFEAVRPWYRALAAHQERKEAGDGR